MDFESFFEDIFHELQDKYEFSRATLPLKDIHGLIPLLCLLGLAGWSMVLVSLQVLWRVGQVITMQKKANQFPSGTPHGPEWYWRATRAHMNMVENLPVFGAIVVVGTLLGCTGTYFSSLSLVYFGARLIQSIAHISSGRSLVVNVRFTFFGVQLVSATLMILHILAQVSKNQHKVFHH